MNRILRRNIAFVCIATVALSGLFMMQNKSINNVYAADGNLTELGESIEGAANSSFTATVPLATYEITLEGGRGEPSVARYWADQNDPSLPSNGGKVVGDVQLEAGDTVEFAFFNGGVGGVPRYAPPRSNGGAGGKAVLAKIKGYYTILGAGGGGGGGTYNGSVSQGQSTYATIYEAASIFGSGGGGGADNFGTDSTAGTGGWSVGSPSYQPGASGQNYFNPSLIKNLQSTYNGVTPKFKITLKSIDSSKDIISNYTSLGAITRVGQFVENSTTATQFEAKLDKGLYKIQMWNTSSKLVEGTIVLNKGERIVFDQSPRSLSIPKSIFASKDGVQIIGIGGIGTTTLLDDGAGNITKQGSGTDTFFGYNGGASYINTGALTDVFSKADPSTTLKYRITLISIPSPDLGDIKRIVNESLDESGVTIKKIAVIRGKNFNINISGYDSINTEQVGPVRFINDIKGDHFITVEGLLDVAGEKAIVTQGKTFLFNVISEPDSNNVTVVFN